MNRLIIKRPGSLLSVITDVELNEEQTSIIEKFVELIANSSPMEIQELELVFQELEHEPPLGGIEQYQAEGR